MPTQTSGQLSTQQRGSENGMFREQQDWRGQMSMYIRGYACTAAGGFTQGGVWVQGCSSQQSVGAVRQHSWKLALKLGRCPDAGSWQAAHPPHHTLPMPPLQHLFVQFVICQNTE